MIHKHTEKMDVTSERIRRTWKLREVLLSFQTSFNLVNAAETPDSYPSSTLSIDANAEKKRNF